MVFSSRIQYKYLYGYRRGADDKPEIIPEEAEVVRWIYERYLAGASTRMLRDELHEQGVTYSEKSPQWTLPHIKSILRNEKYCGDVLMQKTFQQDVINRKVIKNTGQLPMYLIENHHEGIVSREKYNAVQAEMARRKAAKSGVTIMFGSVNNGSSSAGGSFSNTSSAANAISWFLRAS